MKTDRYEGRECLCRDAEDRLVKSHLLEELETPRNATHEHPKKSIGVCVGPVFSAAPTFLGEPTRAASNLAVSLLIDTSLLHYKQHALCDCRVRRNSYAGLPFAGYCRSAK